MLQFGAAVALVVGGTSGIGAGIAAAFLQHGAGVTITGANSTLTLTLGNTNASALTLNADFVDNLPASVVLGGKRFDVVAKPTRVRKSFHHKHSGALGHTHAVRLGAEYAPIACAGPRRS